MYDDCLDGNISDRQESKLYNQIKSFLHDGKNLKIAIKDDRKYDSSIFKLLRDLKHKFPLQLEVRRANEIFSAKVKNAFSKDIFFAVGDAKSIRIEKADMSIPGMNERTAFCSFNKPEYASKLVDVFTSTFNTCPEVSFS